MTYLLYIHGINESDASGDDLKTDWDTHLFGAQSSETAMAFWGDLSVIQRKTLALSFQDQLLCDLFKVSTANTLLRDCYNYFYDTEIRAEIQQRMVALLPPVGMDAEFNILAHSLGTVIAYEVLLGRPDLNVKNFITVGAPLGINAIQSEIRRCNSIPGALPVPACVKHWRNYNDLIDPVAVVHKLKDHFNPSCIIDYEVKNPMAPSKPHNIDGYLEVSEIKGDIAMVMKGG